MRQENLNGEKLKNKSELAKETVRIEALERLAQMYKDIESDLENRLNELETSTNQEIDHLAQQPGLYVEEVELAKERSGLQETKEALGRNIKEIKNREERWFHLIRRRLRRRALLAAGVAMISLPNAAGIEPSQFGKEQSAVVVSGQNEKDIQFVNAIFTTPDGRTKLLSDDEKEPEGISDPNKMKEFVALIQNKIIGHISRGDYLRLLMKELSCTKEEAQKVQAERCQRIKNVEFKIFPQKELERIQVEDFKKSLPEVGTVQAFAVGYPAQGKTEMYFSEDIFKDIATAKEFVTHEVSHIAAMGDEISKDAKNIFSSSAMKTNLFPKAKIYQPSYDYFSNVNELAARKMALDLEMEELGIKKYGDEFTKEHWERLMEFYTNDELSEYGRAFIQVIDPNKFIDIFNNIAKNQNLEQAEKVA